MQLNMYVRQLWDEIFLETENFPKEFVDKFKKVILCSNISLVKIVYFVR